ncbi:MAG: TIGR02757 family protein [Deltaproteobacteria bacterium]|nr:TIGR02757 family protein [Deltaproteobacteria bacterium]
MTEVSYLTKSELDSIYVTYNSRRWVHPDPLEFLYDYEELRDREIAGLIASSLAYGRVSQILKSISQILEKMGPSPFSFIESATLGMLQNNFMDFKHRFTTGKELVLMLSGIKSVIEQHGSLYECFLSAFKKDDETVLPALSFLVKRLIRPFDSNSNSLLPLPENRSACKRLNLFMRWMVREDCVDPGGWSEVKPSQLIIPLDTHMHRICLGFKLTARKCADLKTALDVTDEFRKIDPADPVRYDFGLTRFGIRREMDVNALLKDCA